MILQLSTASSGALADLERRIPDGTTAVERWFLGHWPERTPPVYALVDLRNSGFKLEETAPAGS